MPSRRRTSTPPGGRRHRVAGLLPGSRSTATTEGEPEHGTTVVDTRARGRVDLDKRSPDAGPRPADDLDVPVSAPATGEWVYEDPVDRDGVDDEPLVHERDVEPVEPAVPPADPDAVPAQGSRLAGLRTVPVLVALLAVLVALSAFFVIGTVTLRSTPATANAALTDVAATSEVSAQLGDAVEVIYSYDFARLDENERIARDVITPAFADQFGPLFDQIREVAPQVQAIVSATVTNSAVQSLEGDRAVLVVFMDQQATTVADGQQTTSQGRLTVTGVRIDGRWKVDGVESR